MGEALADVAAWLGVGGEDRKLLQPLSLGRAPRSLLDHGVTRHATTVFGLGFCF